MVDQVVPPPHHLGLHHVSHPQYVAPPTHPANQLQHPQSHPPAATTGGPNVGINVAPATAQGAPAIVHRPNVMERMSLRASRTLRRIPNVPGLLALALCSVAFWAGRISLTGMLLPEPSGPVINTASGVMMGGHGRTLQEKSTNSAVRLIGADGAKAVAIKSGAAASASVLGTAAAMVDPYDIENFEKAVGNALAKVKPPMTPGDSGEAFYRTIPFQILSLYPRIKVFPNFVDKARREEIIALASKFMYPSGLAYRPGEQVEAEQQVRTSKGTFLGGDSSPALTWLESKIAAVTDIPRQNGEFWNVLNYKHTQHYDSHMDSFDPKEYGQQYSQRIATVIVVLSDEGLVGGETVFKREGKANIDKPITNWTDCDADGGLRYKPRAGDAVLFWSAFPDGRLDQHALHGSCPVVTGNKWVAVKWIRNKGSYNP
ncbi:hypothetical protein CHLRE_03g179500v5 [Chlamydomonas reinhardtii]|uniref:Uncharacterized protein n=1 Tax=Chlamydomonas reinhardtii TaxID=3055 RepID=A8IDI8_CHLRE|nr:uncharacterized protein CHLRE_03g179500v5 [Chlamydomonas reinhardtii]PNW85285.1 hypothetical protein CHLRE_03g179500v5 [Chlamydomonas reinhardtii]|eukprot:XP_001703410.1 prolyl 4-hydroxylase [Chlamydomonas reinhardtii]